MKYKIVGEPMPAVICEVENGETMICESGAMSWMSPNMHMETLGGGESLFNTLVTGPGRIVIQTMPISNFAGAISACLPSKS